MVADKYLTQAQADALTFPKMLTDTAGAPPRARRSRPATATPWAPYLMAQVENELTGVDGISQQKLETGGLKIVTTISHSMEQQMYKSVNDNLNSQSIRNTPGATVTSLPAWALVGAELEDPKTGEVIAEYPGKGQNLSAKECKIANCDVNTAVYAREQVGSSFKPYVLSTAVSQGMNVKTSILDTSPYVCIMPDSPTKYSTRSRPGRTACPATQRLLHHERVQGGKRRRRADREGHGHGHRGSRLRRQRAGRARPVLEHRVQ